MENGRIRNNEYPFDEYFFIDDQNLDEYLKRKFNFLSFDRMGAFKTVYGLSYVYDFLYNNSLISEEMYKSCLQIIDDKRKLVLNIVNKEAWQYNFVCIWNKADSINDNDYIAEKDFIEKTFHEDVDFTTYMPEEYMQSFKKIEKRERESKTVKKGPKIGRNDPCPCGSGKKYKKCCGK